MSEFEKRLAQAGQAPDPQERTKRAAAEWREYTTDFANHMRAAKVGTVALYNITSRQQRVPQRQGAWAIFGEGRISYTTHQSAERIGDGWFVEEAIERGETFTIAKGIIVLEDGRPYYTIPDVITAPRPGLPDLAFPYTALKYETPEKSYVHSVVGGHVTQMLTAAAIRLTAA